MGTGYTYCNNCSVATLLQNAQDADYPYWWGNGTIDGAAGLCSIAVTAVQNVQNAGVPNAQYLDAGMLLPIVTNEVCSGCPSQIQGEACGQGTCINADNVGIGLVQITPPNSGHLQVLIDYGLAPASVLDPNGTYDYCPLLENVNENGPLWSLESLAIHIAGYMSGGFSTSNLWNAYYAWNGSGTGAEEYANCALNAYENCPHPCASSPPSCP